MGEPATQRLGRPRFVALRTKTLLLLAATIAGLLIALYIPLRVLMLGSYLRLEQQITSTEIDRASAALRSAITKLDNSTTGYATWDDTYAFVEDRNDQYMAINLADPSFPAEDINLALIVNASGELIGGKAYDLNTQRAVTLPATLQQPAFLHSALFQHAATDSSKTGLVLLPEGPLLVASRPIVTSDGQGPIRGAMLMGRFLDEAMRQKLADTVHLDLAFFPPGDPRMAPAARVLTLDQRKVAVPISDQSIAGYELLLDAFGEPALVLSVTTPRSIYAQGITTVNYFSLALVAIVLASFFASLAGLERMVLRRVAQLDSRVRTIGQSGDLTQRVDEQSNDELTRLAQSINRMLTDIEGTQVKHREAEELRAHTQEQLLRAREQFSQMLVHDLKNPLTGVVGYLDILQLGNLSFDQRECIEGALRGANNAIALVQQILDVARLSEGRLEIRREPADLDQLLNSCAKELHSWARLEDKSITVLLGQDLTPVLVDISLLQRVLMNLLSNAIKHTPPRTAITLGARQLHSETQIYIHDTGPGIDAELLPNLFERFSGASAEPGRQSNTGLGLAFCKLAVEAHHGTLQVYSAPGAGTTFTLSLPAPSAPLSPLDSADTLELEARVRTHTH